MTGRLNYSNTFGFGPIIFTPIIIFLSQAGLSGGGGAKVHDIGRKRIGFAKGGRRRKEKKEETISKENYIGKISKDWFWCTAGDLEEEKGLVGALGCLGERNCERKSGLNKIVIGGLEVRIVTCV